jgi:sugar O-acyltransferase (sialic acid O-acetyltransferase NeuD family)
MSADKPYILIIGASGQARVLIDTVEQEGKYRIAGLLDQAREAGEEVMGYPILGQESSLPHWQEQYQLAGGLIAIGDNWIRQQVYRKLQQIQPDFKYVTAIHPRASLAKGVEIGEGTVVMAGAVINSNSRVGRFCILNTRSSLDHDGQMGDFSSLAPGVTLGGGVAVGDFTAISLGANVIHGLKIGAHAVIGAGATVLKDVPDQVVAYGSPARIIRRREVGERYL